MDAGGGQQVSLTLQHRLRRRHAGAEACPAGASLTGGGAEALGNASILNGGFPTNASTWAVVGHQPGVGNLGLSSYAIYANN